MTASTPRDWERERESYRDTVDKRRDWPSRERGAPPSVYEASDSYAPYPVSATSKYGYEARDYADRRAASPSANLGRDRDFDSDRSRDRDRDRVSERDPPAREPSSGRASGGMRQWGKPTDASIRGPASEDARSDTSQRQSTSRSNTTPPEAGTKPVASDLAAEKGEVTSRDVSPQPTLQTNEGNREEAEAAAPLPSEVAPLAPSAASGAQDAKAEDPAARVRASEAQSDGVSEQVAAESAKQDNAGSTAGPSAAATQLTTEQTLGDNISTAEISPPSAGGSGTVELAQPNEKPTKNQDEDTPGHQVPAVAEAPADPSPADIEVPQPESQDGLPSQPETNEAQLSGKASGDAEQVNASAAPLAQAPSKEDASHTAVETLPSSTEITNVGVPSETASSHIQDEPMQSQADEVTQSQVNQQSDAQATQLPTTIADDSKTEDARASTAMHESVPCVTNELVSTAVSELQDARVKATEQSAAAVQAPASADLDTGKQSDGATADVEMPDAAQQQEQAQEQPAKADAGATDLAVAPPTPVEAEADLDIEGISTVSATAEGMVPDVTQIPASSAADGITGEQPVDKPSEAADARPEDDVEMESVDQTPVESSAPEAPMEAAEKSTVVDETPVKPLESANGPVNPGTTEPAPSSAELKVKTEEEQPAQVGDASMTEASVETISSDLPVEQDSKIEGPIDEPGRAADADAASVVEAASAVVPVSEPQVVEASLPPSFSSQVQVSGPHVTASIDVQAQTQEITLPHVDYGDDKEARALAEQETARIEEVEMPAPDGEEPSLRIAEIDDTDRDIEPPLMTPSTQEQMDKAIHFALRHHIAEDKILKDDWKRILKENQIVSQRTTMDVLKAKIYGIPLLVSSDQPLWLEEDDKQAERIKAQLFPQLLDRKKRLNAKIESLKKSYRSINEEWKLHCQRLDRSAERRELLRRPPANTPAGTPGVFGVEEPSPGGGGGGGGGSLLSASLTTGRANRRSAQTGGFAGFGDAVRSEAEFLEILASLENADMQDPNMRAARTTATAPDMAINVDSDQLTKLRYDDLNGHVADPLAFYLDEFDPDVWSEEEKAIFARRYALWPKQFGRIAQALPHKTPAQCVRYYYLNKKVPGNDFKALAAARNRERKRKARVKPKKAKGSALMADLKSAKGEEADDVEDGSGMRSPVEAVDPSASLADVPIPSNGRRGGRARMVPAIVEGNSEEVAAGRKRTADQGESDTKGVDAKSDKRKSGPKSKRAKSDSASATEKSRKSKSGGKKDLTTVEESSSAAPASVKAEGSDEITSASAPPAAHSAELKAGMEDSDLAAAEALAGLFGGPATGETNTAADGVPGEVDADGRKAGKKRRSKTSVPGEEGGADVGGGKGRGKQPTSSYWSVAERYEFLRALVTHGPRWEVVSSTLAQKSTAQARNYFARNEDEVDFAEAAALARSHADAPLEEREAAALAFVRQRFASNSASAVPSLPSAAGSVPALALSAPGFGNEAVPGTTHLPPPPGISSFQGDAMDAKMRDESPEAVAPRRGLQINSLLNDSADAASHRTARRSSLHDWHAERGDPAHPAASRDVSVPPSLYARQGRDLDARPLTADHLETGRPATSDGRTMRDDHDGRARAYDRLDMHRSAAEGRDPRDDAVDSRPWMYDSPYDAHRRPMPSSGYAAMAPPTHPADRSSAASRYSMPPSSVSSAGHVARSAPPMHSHLSSSDDVEAERERDRERDRAGYNMYGASGRSREHESHSMPPSVPGEQRRAVSGEQISPTGAHFGTSHGYSRYPTTGVGSVYASTTAASAALASRNRPTNGPLTAPLPSTSERPAYEQRWRGYSQSPGPTSAGSSAAHLSSSSTGGYSTASAYRSSNSPYSSFPSQSLPRPSLPSLSASGGKPGAPHLPSLGAAGRSLPPILGTFPASGRSALGAGSRPAGTGEEARYWPYPHRPRGHDQGPSSRTPE
uniref:SANT domain-containing protein n=1 Tax=Kalmanozyma brasiliensis (strain GHG001) TaxID=1365824 RepID=V5ETL4_KALBG